MRIEFIAACIILSGCVGMSNEQTDPANVELDIVKIDIQTSARELAVNHYPDADIPEGLPAMNMAFYVSVWSLNQSVPVAGPTSCTMGYHGAASLNCRDSPQLEVYTIGNRQNISIDAPDHYFLIYGLDKFGAASIELPRDSVIRLGVIGPYSDNVEKFQRNSAECRGVTNGGSIDEASDAVESVKDGYRVLTSGEVVIYYSGRCMF